MIINNNVTALAEQLKAACMKNKELYEDNKLLQNDNDLLRERVKRLEFEVDELSRNQLMPKIY